VPEFSLAPPSKFVDVIKDHDRFLTNELAAWQTMVTKHKSEIAKFLQKYPGTASLSKASIENVLASSSTGSASCFDPWNGKWQGDWNGGGTPSPQFHFWDVTVAHGNQHIQPVTQSTHQLVDATNLSSSFAVKQVDIGLNAWKAGRGISGFVTKYQNTPVKKLPHIGYLLNRHTLLWIAQERPGNGDYFMFFEWADPGNGKYSIHGKSFEITGSGTFNPKNQTLGKAEYKRP